MGLEAALAWKTCAFGLTKKETTMSRQFIYKKTIELYCDLWKLFYTSGNSIDLILVDKCPVCYQIMEKKK